MVRPAPRRFTAAWVFATLLASASPASALDPSQRLDHYVHRSWTTDDGLPQSSIYAVVQASDGYLWLGTDEGLVRFDGLRFVIFDRLNTEALRDQFVFSLLEGRDGSLWIGTDRGGLTRLKNGRFSHYGPADGLPAGRIQAIAEDAEGVLWVGLRGAGLARLEGGRVQVYTMRDGLSSDEVLALRVDGQGTLWVGTAAGLDRFARGRLSAVSRVDGVPPGGVRAIYEDRSGRLWAGEIRGQLNTRLTGGGLSLVTERGLEPVPLGPALARAGVTAILEDRDGSLWIGTNGLGIARLRDGRVESWALTDLPADDMVFALAEDAEGSLWLGTTPGGLHRLKSNPFLTLTARDGLPDEVVESLYEDRSGAMWIGTHAGGVCRRAGDAMTCRSRANGLPHDRVNAILEDEDGSVWLGTEGGLARLRGTQVTIYTTSDGLPANHVNALVRDRSGGLWVGTWGGGVARIVDGRVHVLPGEAAPGRFVNVLYEDRSSQVWIGTTEGLGIWANGRMTDATRSRGMPVAVEAVYEDADGLVWIGTRRDGLFLSRGGSLTQFTVRQGLFDNLVGTLVEDAAGFFWISCNKGLFRVSRQQLLEVAEGRRATVDVRTFDTVDGMKAREANFGQGRWKTRDGKLWFATVGGVVVADLRRLKRNEVPPTVHVEEILVDGEPSDPAQPVVMLAGRRRLEFRFVGLSLTAPARVRYRYMLDGFDAGWTDGADTRTAHYTNVTPGAYRFRVMAANGDGVWSPDAATIALTVESPWWGRPEFAAASAVAAGSLLLVGTRRRRARLAQRRNQEAEFSRELIRAQETERRRLAADLHDGIGQHLLVINNWAQLAIGQLGDPARARSSLEVIAETASQSVQEVRTVTRQLQPYEIDHVGLAETIRAMLATVSDSSGIAFVADIGALERPLPADAAVHLFRIVQEASNNIVKHSQATEARVMMRETPAALEVRVWDNGRGFSAAASTQFGFGLRSLDTRARMLGGSCRVHSVPGQGTTVAVDVPA